MTMRREGRGEGGEGGGEGGGEEGGGEVEGGEFPPHRDFLFLMKKNIRTKNKIDVKYRLNM